MLSNATNLKQAMNIVTSVWRMMEEICVWTVIRITETHLQLPVNPRTSSGQLVF